MKNENYEKLGEALKDAKKVLIIGHRKPDGDALGSMAALKMWLESMGKVTGLACHDKPAGRYAFLPFMDIVETDIDLNKWDTVIFVDCGAHYMTDFHEKHPMVLAKNQVDSAQIGPTIINIDHHASNDNFGHINIVDEHAASTTMILYDIFEYFGAEISPQMATCLLTGIYNDTGSFMHSNTSGSVYHVAAELLAKGAKISPLIKSLFKTMSVPSLKAWGKAMMNARVIDDNFLLSVVKKEDFAEGEESEQLGGVIDYLNMVPDVKFSMLLREDGGRVKGSLRTKREDVDLSKIASIYGGGGHPKASGFSIPGKIVD